MTNSYPLPSLSLPQEKEATLALLASLKEEQDILCGNGNIEDMPELISEKASAVAKMATLADQRHKYLAMGGFDASENGMQTWLDAHGSEEAQQLWTELFELAQNARELNRLNGQLINKQMAMNQNAMSILQGKNNSNLYGPTGQASVRPTGRPLGVV